MRLASGCLVSIVLCGSCGASERCRPAAMRACTVDLEGGFTQGGTQMCGGDGRWADCVGNGTCQSSAGQSIVPYARCATTDDCGPSGCASCISYAAVQNASGVAVCAPFCSVDTDCAPSVASAGITPRCSSGQCILLCTTGASCPGDAQCLPWSTAAAGADFPGTDGLCD